MNVVMRKLVAKDLYVNRWFIAGGAIAAVASVVIAGFGKTGFSVGSLSWLTTLVATAVMLAIYGVMYERKEQSLQFVLSLPLSVEEYVAAKLLGVTVCFLLVWIPGSAAALVLVFGSDSIPDGIAPYTVLLCVFMLANFAVVMCGSIHARTEALTTSTIILTNMSLSIFMFTIAPLSEIGPYMWKPQPFWSSTFWIVLGCELVVMVVALTLPFFFAARRRNFL
jgi:ABC-2 type transport system permease protein